MAIKSKKKTTKTKRDKKVDAVVASMGEADKVGRDYPTFMFVDTKNGPARNPHYIPPMLMPAGDTRAPDGEHTFDDVISSLRRLRLAMSKDVALAVLHLAGHVGSVRDLAPRDYDAVVQAANEAAISRTVTQVPRMPYGLHFALRAIESFLKGDPVLVQHASLAAGTDYYGPHIAMVHEEGRRAANLLLAVAKSALTTDYPILERPVTKNALQGHLRAIERLLKPDGYNWERRREAAARARAAIEIWSVAVASEL